MYNISIPWSDLSLHTYVLGTVQLWRILSFLIFTIQISTEPALFWSYSWNFRFAHIQLYIGAIFDSIGENPGKYMPVNSGVPR